jgi:homocysteine S-methyltransferase
VLFDAFRKPLILDGGLATELERRGEDLGDSLWSARVLVDRPSLIRDVHRDYLMAGANVITSASYQCSFEGLARKGLDRKEAAALMKSSVRLAQQARELFWADPIARGRRARPLVAASLGSYGATLANGSEYTGAFGLSDDALVDWHRPRFDVLAESGADLLAIETIPSLQEAEALARLLEDSPIPAWISFSCCDERKVGSGDSLADCFKVVQDVPGVIAVGINCTPPGLISDLARSVREVARKPLLVYPNSGEIWEAKARAWTTDPRHGPFDWEAHAHEWSQQLGVVAIGGCCRTTPETIARLARATSGGS